MGETPTSPDSAGASEYPLRRDDPRAIIPKEWISNRAASNVARTGLLSPAKAADTGVLARSDGTIGSYSWTNKSVEDAGVAPTHGSLDALLSAKHGIPGNHPDYVFGTDERTYVSDTTQFPNRAVVKIFTTVGECSGALYGDRFVVTAGHCVFDVVNWVFANANGNYSWGVVVPGMDGFYAPFGWANIIGYTIYPGFTDDIIAEGFGHKDLDLSMLVLDRPFGSMLGSLGAQAAPASGGALVKRWGYPGEKPRYSGEGSTVNYASQAGQYQLGSSGWVNNYNTPTGAGMLAGPIDTTKGDSGSAILDNATTVSIGVTSGENCSNLLDPWTCDSASDGTNIFTGFTTAHVNWLASQAASYEAFYPLYAGGPPQQDTGAFTNTYGAVFSDPVAISPDNGFSTMYLAIGEDGQLYTRRRYPWGWSPTGGWTYVGALPGGSWATKERVAAATTQAGDAVVVFVRGVIGNVYGITYTLSSNTWSAWTNYGMNITQAPIAVSPSTGITFVMGVDASTQHLYMMENYFGGVYGPYDLGGPVLNCAVTSRYANEFDTICLTYDGFTIENKVYDSGSWWPSMSTWNTITTVSNVATCLGPSPPPCPKWSGPLVAASLDSGHIDVFAFSVSGTTNPWILYNFNWTSDRGTWGVGVSSLGTWSAWPGRYSPAEPKVMRRPDQSVLDIFLLGGDDAYYWAQKGRGQFGWISGATRLGGGLGLRGGIDLGVTPAAGAFGYVAGVSATKITTLARGTDGVLYELWYDGTWH